MPLNLIMLGPPGAGKGTQAERVARERGIPKISTGDILRLAADEGTEIGLHARETMSRGELVSDDVMIGIVRDRIGRDDARNGFVLDGFPRTVAQARSLDQMIAGRDPLIVVEIVVPEGELVRRLSQRLVCKACGATAGGFVASSKAACDRCGGALVQRMDDDEAVVRARLQIYLRQTQPLVEYYEARPTFRSVNGAQAPDRVAADLVAAIDALAGGMVAKEVRS